MFYGDFEWIEVVLSAFFEQSVKQILRVKSCFYIFYLLLNYVCGVFNIKHQQVNAANELFKN